MNGAFEGNFGVKSDDFRFSPQNLSSKSILRQNFAIKLFIEWQSHLNRIIFAINKFYPQKCNLKVCVSFCTDCIKVAATIIGSNQKFDTFEFIFSTNLNIWVLFRFTLVFEATALLQLLHHSMFSLSLFVRILCH